MKIYSPTPGAYIAPASGLAGLIPSGSVPTTHTPGSPDFDQGFRRIDGSLLKAVLVSEEACWERAYLLCARDDDFSRIPRQLATFVATYASSTHSAAIYPSTQTFSGPAIYGEWAVATPSDRNISTRRVYRPALTSIIESAFVNTDYGAPHLRTWQNLAQYLANSVSGATTSSSYGPWSHTFGSSLLDGDTLAFPATGWVDYLDLIDELAGWVGHHVLADGLSTQSRPALFWALEDSLYIVTGGTSPWTYAQVEAFRNTHTLSTLPLPPLMDAAFGSTIDYLAVLTDASRRITFDKLAAFNRIAASLDRGYIDNPPRTLTASGVTTRTSIDETLWGTIAAGDLIIAADGSISVRSGATPTWDAPIDETRATTEADSAFDPQYGSMFAEFTSNIVASTKDLPQTVLTVQGSTDDIFDDFTPEEIAAGSATFDYSGLSITQVGGAPAAAYNVTHNGASRTFTVPVNLALIGDARFYIQGSADVRFSRASRPSAAAFTVFPADGVWAGDYIREAEVGTGLAVCEGPALDSLYFKDFRSVATLKTAKFAASKVLGRNGANDQLLAQLRDGYDKMVELLEDDLGFDPTDPSGLSNDVSNLVDSVKPHVTFSPGFSARSPDDTLVMTVHLTPTGGIDHVTWSDSSRLVGTIQFALGASGSGSTPSPSAAAGVSMDFLALRIDWNFHTLRLNAE